MLPRLFSQIIVGQLVTDLHRCIYEVKAVCGDKPFYVGGRRAIHVTKVAKIVESNTVIPVEHEDGFLTAPDLMPSNAGYHTAPSLAKFELYGIYSGELIRWAWAKASYPEIKYLSEIKYQLNTNHHRRHQVVDKIFESSGVEHLGKAITGKNKGYHHYYCNAGDTYNATLFFFGNKMFISTYGDVVESTKFDDGQN